MAESDKVFAGSIPKFYDTLMVPLIFEAYAAGLAELVAASSPGSGNTRPPSKIHEARVAEVRIVNASPAIASAITWDSDRPRISPRLVRRENFTGVSG